MATGDVTLTVIGVFDATDIAAGVTVGAATNVGTQDAASQTNTLHFVPTGEAGQVMVFREARAA